MSGLGFAHPWWLALLPLALLPLIAPPSTLRYSWLALVPSDPLSGALGALLRLTAAAAIGALVIGLAGLQRPQSSIERIGRGAEIVLLLDRSRSMDQTFVTDPARHVMDSRGETKGQAARRLLARFAAGRSEDLFGMLIFSSFPIPVLPLTQKAELVQAAIAAGEIGRGLAETDIGRALLAAAAMFDGRDYAGSRIILLVSDGGAQLDMDTRKRIENAMKRNRIGLYWIYIRSFRSPPLAADAPALAAGEAAADDTAPEQFLHRYFRSMGTPYRAYQADNPEALERAMADVHRLEHLPIRYREAVPREDLSGRCYAAALAACALLLGASLIELRRWH